MTISSSMNIDVNGALKLTTPDIIGQRIGVLGTSGTGKSNTTKVLAEELASSAQPIPMSIIDHYGEYWPLKEIGQFLVVGRGEHADLDCDIEHLPQLARFSVEHGVSVIISPKHLHRRDFIEYAEIYLSALWEHITAQVHKRPYFLLVEEAHELAPERGKSEAKEVLISFAKLGRKQGCGLIVATQRPAAISKDVITQTSLLFLHNVTYPKDKAVYKDIVPLPPKEVEGINQGLQVGHAMVVRDGRTVSLHTIRKIRIFDAGKTPTFDEVTLPPLRPVDASMLADIRQRLAAPPDEATQIDTLRRRISELEQANLSQAAEIADLRAENDRLKTTPQVFTPVHLKEPNGTTPLASQLAMPVPAPITEAAILDRAADRAQQLSASAHKRQQQAFDNLVGVVDRKTPAAWKEAFAFLSLRDGERMTIHRLARDLSFNAETLYKNQPHVMLDELLLQRAGKTTQTEYWSTTRATLAERFPLLDVEVMLDRLLTLAKK